MAKYREYQQLDLVKTGNELLKFWEENKVFEQSINSREGKPTFTFYEGPPSANGMPGIHHVMARTIKDMYCRYKTIRGYQVKRKGGWDTHGLPVELKVEKDLGITKEDIGTKISVEEYNQRCREAVMKFKGVWDNLTRKMGYWVDLDDPYITFDRNYIETLWNLLKKLYDKDLLYKGYTIQPYSPKAGTGLSSHELNQPGCYRDVKDTSAVAQFKVKKDEKSAPLFEGTDDEVFILAWTTTPWTLPSNSALAVGEKITYLRVKTFNPYTFKPAEVILAKDRLNAYFTEKQKKADFDSYKEGDKVIPFKVTAEFTGKDLCGVRYEQLLPYIQPEGDAFRVIPGDFVSTEDGTGIVHIAPTFGADDYRVAQQADIPAILVKDENGTPMPLVDKQGRFVKEVTDFPLRYVKAEYEDDETLADSNYKSTDVLISIKLKEENRAFKVEKYEHSYPHCWRTDKPILYYPLDSWFIKTTAYKDKLVAANKTINWKPAATGTGRFGNWLENLVDWNLSRSRFWGTPLPVWRTEDNASEKCIGSIAELNDEVKKAVEAGVMAADSKVTAGGVLKDDFDLHRPYVDDVILVSDDGKAMYREPDLIDVWFDSGAMPYAQWHYPFENKEIFEESFPADFISEGVDQTRGWFFTLHALAVMLEFPQSNISFKNVVSTGLLLDANGAKMSKRLGNVIDPFETIDTYSADATRWYMLSNAQPWDNLKFNLEGVKEVQRKFFGTLYNTYSFFALYANLDGFKFEEEAVPVSERTESDRWIISRLNTLIEDVKNAMDDYESTKAVRAIESFTIDDLSNWYVRQNRKRFWKGEYNRDKMAAYQTLYTCLETISCLMSPFSPFFSDRLFQDLNEVTGKDKSLSVHLSDFPEVDTAVIDKDLEERMDLAQKISSLVHSLRRKESIKVRQPLSKILIPDLNEKVTRQIKAVEDIINAEVNIKEIEYIDDSSGVLVKKIKPNFKVLGKQYGKLMRHISAAIAKFEQADITKLEKEQSYAIEVEGETITLSPDDVEITSEDIPGWLVARDYGLTVAMDITITDELRKEGIAREVVNRVQNLRKDMGLEVQDKINIEVLKGESLAEEAFNAHKKYICEETQALNLSFSESLEGATAIDLGDVTIEIKVAKA
ncbi:isoleucine--tRNA ligase [Chondrinema litorale]|uniref:isoleucine--tRNA ligase n=1 Tax=Chondrinema litorale TaxID=2994555 RepID=UPI002544B8C8|nr:isoleucine--tRNA ligase [Chondrinema litorale]UZR95822.1 isoleucine--tRNA ligase [Chondrinema litorale]